MYDIVIIGAGVAGMTSAIYAKRAGRSVLVLEKTTPGGQIINSLNVENWPGEQSISGADLTDKIYHQMHNLAVELKYETVLSVKQSTEFANDQDAKADVRRLWLVQTDETEYLARAIIIATGTEPRKLSAKQLQAVGTRPISYCATCDGTLYKDQPVVVVGSGNTAKHEIKYLKNIASQVYHIHHDDPIPSDARAVFVAIGRVPATDVFQNLVDLDDDGYIVAAENCQTSTPGIFVAGDSRTKHLRQLVTASSDGAAAAISAINFLS